MAQEVDFQNQTSSSSAATIDHDFSISDDDRITFQNYAAVTNQAGHQAFYGPVNFYAHGPGSNTYDQPLHTKFGLTTFEAPELETSLFVGRELEIQKMKESLQPSSNGTVRNVLVLAGMAGLGKTQLALTYTKQCRECYDSIFWLNAESKATLEASMLQIAQRVSPTMRFDDKEIAQTYVKNWLSNEDNREWLLIFDGYDDLQQFQISEYYPPASHGSIIITSRRQDSIPGATTLLLRYMTTDESLQILKKRSERSNVELDPGARQLAIRLDGLPIALATAGAFLKKTTMSFHKYLQMYEAKWKVAHQPINLSEYSNTLYTTWNISYEYLKNENSKAANMLSFFAFLDNRDIWYALIAAGASSRAPEWYIEAVKDLSEFESIMGVLAEFCFVETQLSRRSYSVHNCVQDWALNGLNIEAEINKSLYWVAFDCIANSVARNDRGILHKIKFRRLVPHAERLVQPRFDSMWNTDALTNEREKAQSIAELFYKQLRFKDGEKLYQRALEGKKRALGPEHKDTLRTILYLGTLYKTTGKLEKAHTMYQQALDGFEKSMGPNDSNTLHTVHCLGALYKAMGKLDKSQTMYQRAVVGYEKALGPDHLSTLGAVSDLGSLCRDLGQFFQAQIMYQRALTGFERELGLEHIDTLCLINNLGMLYGSLKQVDKAQSMYQQALDGYEKVLGPGHPSTLMTVNNLGLLYADQGHFKEAEDMYQRALTGTEKTFGPDHSSTLLIVSNLGLLYADARQFEKAQPFYQRALAGKENTLGPSHTSTLATVSNMAILLFNIRQLEPARIMFQRALIGYEKALGPTHSSTIRTAVHLHNVHVHQGRSVSAAVLRQKYKLKTGR